MSVKPNSLEGTLEDLTDFYFDYINRTNFSQFKYTTFKHSILYALHYYVLNYAVC